MYPPGVQHLDPVQHLLARAEAAASVVERHHCAYYAVEASLRIAVATRLAIWREEAPEDPGVSRFLQRIQRASLGTWAQGLRALDAWLQTARPGHGLAGLLQEKSPPALRDLAEACATEGVVTADVARSAKRSVGGCLDMAVAYRNAVLGHGVWREHAFYARLGEVWLGAARSLAGTLNAGLHLAILKDGIPVPIDELTQSPVGTGSLAILSGRTVLDLGPLVCWRAHPLLGRVQVGFLDKVVQRREKVVRTAYLDYASGEHFALEDLSAIQALLALVESTETEETEDDPDLEFLEVIGRGATATVHLAVQHSLERRVAVKVLDAERADDPIAAQRFQREVQALARVDHPAVVRLLSAGSHKGCPSFIMEYVDGEDLAVLSRRLGRPDSSTHGADALGAPSEPRWKAACRLFADVAEGVEALHRAGILHRDIKPANLLLPREAGRLVLVDLGLARLTDGADLTREDGQILGTLRYMAPEQLQRGLLEVDHRVDVYALCASLYELVTGAPPHDGSAEGQLVTQILQRQIPPARSAAPWLPAELETVLAVGLSRDVEARYASAADLAADLRAVADGRPIRARPVGMSRRVRLGLARYRLPIAAVTATAVAAAALGLWVWDAGRLKVDYTTSVSMFAGGWIGVGDLPGDPGPTGFRITHRGGQVESIAWRPGWREPGPAPHIAFAPWASAITQDYDDDGRVLRQVWRDTTGEALWHVAVSHEEDRVRWQYQTRRGLPMRGPSLSMELGGLVGRWEDAGVYEIVWTLDDEGWPERATYWDIGGQSTMNDGDDIAGIAWKRDESGRPVVQAHLDLEGKARPTSRQAAQLQVRYDADGWRPSEVTFHDADGGVATVAEIASISRNYDDWGRPLRITWRDADGAVHGPPPEPNNRAEFVLERIMHFPALQPLVRCGDRVQNWSDAGEMTRYACADSTTLPPGINTKNRVDLEWEDGLPVKFGYANDDGTWTASGAIVVGWQDAMLVANHRVDTDGEVLKRPGAPVGYRFQRDGRGRMGAYWREDANGAAVPMSTGVVRGEFTWDDDGNMLSTQHFGLSERPVLSGDRIHGTYYEYNALGLRTAIHHRDTEGRPAMPVDAQSHHTPASYAFEYDNRGRLTEERKFDDRGRPFSTEGWATLKRTHKPGGYLDVYFDEVGEPTANLDGCEQLFDRREHGKEAGGTCFDADGAPALSRYGWHESVATFDSAGNKTSQALFGIDGQPIKAGDQYHHAEYGHDLAGRLTSVHYSDTDGRPSATTRELHTDRLSTGAEYELTPTGRVASLTQVGLDGEPILTIAWTYDNWDRVATVKRSANAPMASHLVKEMAYTYDDRGFLASIHCTPVTGEPWILRLEHDERGVMLAYDVTDLDGNPGEGRLAGLFRSDAPTTKSPLSYGMDIEIPVGIPWGSAHPLKVVFGRIEVDNDIVPGTTDGLGDLMHRPEVHLREVRFYDGDREPLAIDGVHRREMSWTDLNKIASLRTYGVHGEPVDSAQGAFLAEWAYDREGRVTTWALYGADGQPVDHPRGKLAREETTYTEDGYQREVVQTRADGSLRFRRVRTYDDDRRLVEIIETGAQERVLSLTWQPGQEVRIRKVLPDGPGTFAFSRKGSELVATEIRLGRDGHVAITGDGPVPIDLRDVAFLEELFDGRVNPFTW